MVSLSLSSLHPTGDTLQPTADGTANFPLFLHPSDELHPLCPAQLSISAEDPPEAACQSPRPSPDGRRWASVPLPPGIWVSSQPSWRWRADLLLDGCQRGQVNGMGFIEALCWYMSPVAVVVVGPYLCTCAQCLLRAWREQMGR